MKIITYKGLFLLILVLLSGCFSIKYNLGGATVDPKLKTVSVQYINNRALTINPTLSQTITEKLRTYLESNTSLRVVNTVGDADFSGEITTYNINTASISSGDRESQIRFTITVRIKYTDSINPDNNFDTSFSQYRDFPSSTNFNSVEATYTEEIVNELVEQIFNKAFVNW